MPAPLRHPDFRRFFAGQATSVVGDRLVVVALALFVTDLTGDPTDLGLVLGAGALPLVAFLLVGGVWADRLPRHRVVVVTDLVRATLHGVLAALILTDTVQVWHIVVIEAAFGTAEAFFRPALTGLLPETVPEPLIQEARALTAVTESAAELAGPALATVLVVGVGAGWAFALDATSFLVSAALLAGVRPRARGVAAQRQPFAADLRAGWREVRTRSWVWVTIAVFSLILLVGLAPWFVLGPTIARDVYGDTATYGVVMVAFGAGAVTGALAGLRYRPARPMLVALLAMLPWPVAIGLFASGAPIAVVLVGFFAAGIGFSVFGVLWETALARRIPSQSLARVAAYDWMGSLVLLPVGYVMAGPVAAAVGAQTVLGVGAALTFLLLGSGLLPRGTRSLRA